MKLKIILFALFLGVGIWACDDDKQIEEKSIIGTWKCVGIGNIAIKEIKSIEPKDCEQCYTLKFEKNGLCNGFAAANKVEGTYKINKKLKTIIHTIHSSTLVLEPLEAQRYLEILQKVKFYDFSSNTELRLYFNNRKEYLKFKLR